MNEVLDSLYMWSDQSDSNGESFFEESQWMLYLIKDWNIDGQVFSCWVNDRWFIQFSSKCLLR